MTKAKGEKTMVKNKKSSEIIDLLTEIIINYITSSKKPTKI